MYKKSGGTRMAGMVGQVRSPLSGSMIVGKMRTPPIGANTNIPGTAPKAAPIRSPNAPYVLKSGSRAGRNS